MATYEYMGDARLLYLLTKLDTLLRGNGIANVANHGLSMEDFTTTLLTKLNGITESADAVSFTRVQNTGTKIATITINSTDIDIYVPTVTIDSAMSDVSENPVQNKIVKGYIDSAVASVVQIRFDADTTGQGYTSLTDLQTKHPTGAAGTIYLVQHGGSGTNTKDEYFWDSNSLSYEKFGTTDIDLSNYVQKTDLAEISEAQVDAAWNAAFSVPSGS